MSGEDNPNPVQNVKSWWQAKLKKVMGGHEGLLPHLNLLLDLNLNLNLSANPPFFDSSSQGF